MHARHAGNVNLNFADGHATGLIPDEMGGIWKQDRTACSSFGDLRIFLQGENYKVFPGN
jgi:prepilin-type processing-associated H-X9-DG protein